MHERLTGRDFQGRAENVAVEWGRLNRRQRCPAALVHFGEQQFESVAHTGSERDVVLRRGQFRLKVCLRRVWDLGLLHWF